MPTLLRYGPIGLGAQAAENVGDERLRSQRQAENYRRQQAYEEQRRYDESMQRQREQDRLNEELRREAQQIERDRNASIDNYRGDQLVLNQQRLNQADTPAEKWKRLKEKLIADGDMQGARLAAQREQQERRLEHDADKTIYTQGAASDRNAANIAAGDRRQGERLDYDAAKTGYLEDGRNSRSEAQRQARDAAAQRKAMATQELANAKTQQQHDQALLKLAQEQLDEAYRDMTDWENNRPTKGRLGYEPTQEQLMSWEGERQRREQVRRAAQQSMMDVHRRIMQGQPQPQVQQGPQGPMPQPMPQPRVATQDLEPLFNPPMQTPQQQGPIDPQLAQFIQFYNSLPPGTPYTAPDGSQRIKQ